MQNEVETEKESKPLVLASEHNLAPASQNNREMDCRHQQQQTSTTASSDEYNANFVLGYN